MTHLDDTDLDSLAAQARSFAPLPMDEVRGLLGRVRDEGVGTAHRRLVEHHLNVVLTEAMARGDKGVDITDLYQEGTVATMVAISEYASRSGRPEGLHDFVSRVVGSHLDGAIESEVLEEVAEQALVRDVKTYESAEVRLRHELARAPTAKELSVALHWPEDRVAIVGEMLNEARQLYDTDIVNYLDEP